MLSLLDLELEDFLDPSLPRMYSRDALLKAESEPEPFVFTTEFTDANPEFRNTSVMPSCRPPRLENNRLILERVSARTGALKRKQKRNSNAGVENKARCL